MSGCVFVSNHCCSVCIGESERIAAVIGLSTIHGSFSRWRRDFENDANRHSARFYRYMNEIPTVLMVAIVLLVVLQPF